MRQVDIAVDLGLAPAVYTDPPRIPVHLPRPYLLANRYWTAIELKITKSSTTEQTFGALTKQPGQIASSEIETVYNKLKPVRPEFLIGQWKGGSLDTGHPAHQSLEQISGQGKTFHDVDNVDPIDVLKHGQRVCDESWGHAVRKVKFRNVVSTAIIYDNRLIIDHFRYVNDRMVAGGINTKKFGSDFYYFYVYR